MSTDLEIKNIPLNDILADSDFNCRGIITPMDVVDLAEDIKKNGLLQPAIVMAFSEPERRQIGKSWKLIAGFRRYMAHVINEAPTIKCTIMEHMDEAHAVLLNLSENLKRKDLSIIQEARAIDRLRMLGTSEPKCAEAVGKSRTWVQIRYMLLKLPAEVQDEVESGMIPQSTIRELFTVMQTMGNAKAIEEAKRFKEEKQTGKKPRVQKEKDADLKKARTKPEIFEMIEHILATIGAGVGSRSLGWAAGEITDGDLFEAIALEAELLGIEYKRPY